MESLLSGQAREVSVVKFDGLYSLFQIEGLMSFLSSKTQKSRALCSLSVL